MVRFCDILSPYARKLMTNVRTFPVMYNFFSVYHTSDKQEVIYEEFEGTHDLSFTYKFQLADTIRYWFNEHVMLVCEIIQKGEGKVWCIFRYKSKFFMVTMDFGSCIGCNEWIFLNEHEFAIQIKYMLLSVIPYKSLNDILKDYQYMSPEWKAILALKACVPSSPIVWNI